MEGKDDMSGPMERAAIHGPDPLLEGKHRAFEAQLREELGERAIHGINKAEAELPGVMDRARQGLATLRRRLSDSMEGIGWGGGAGAGGTNNPPPEVGEVGYGDPASELHSNMKEAMEEAAKAIHGGPTKVIMEQDPPHVHAPELFHPEQVMSMAEVRSQTQQHQQEAAASNVRVKETVRAAVHSLNNMAEDAREGIGMGKREGGGNDDAAAADAGDSDALINESLEAMITYFPE